MKNDVPRYSLPLGALGDEPGVGTGDLVANDTELLYEDVRAHNGITIAHTSGTRMGTDWHANDPELDPVVEIFQGCRTSYERVGAPLVARPDRDAAHIKRAGYKPDGMVSNHTYGATDNIILDVHMGNHFMGDEFSLDRPLPLRVKARGTRPIVKVDIIKDNKVVYSTKPGRQDVSLEFTDTGSVAGRHFYYVRLQQDDRMIAWSSPMFINYK